MSMRDVIVTAMVDARHQWRAEGKKQSAWDDYNRFIADAVLAVLPLPSAEVRKAIIAMKADMKLMAQLLLDHGIVPPMLPHVTSDVRASIDAYLAALEATE
ncbi:MAG: hypothetical protein IT337_17610 [Thermomicrobiales bacterium]|nr:hypothetical protein [Thermomicrobiales bacterium]